MSYLVGALYLIAVAGLVFFGIHRLKMVWSYGRASRDGRAGAVEPRELPLDPPRVCIQCPIYNEPLVVTGLLAVVASIEWDPEKLEVQLLDDSTDETTGLIERWLRAHPGQAGRFRHLRRSKRTGYKAGALAHGMANSGASFFAVFDADFRPRSDFLRVLMKAFADPGVGMVQARWDFSNRRASLLTRLQAVYLDAHFVVEQAARAGAGLFFNFNGTAGIWRREALVEAGGWSADTVTEDLDISYRAQMAGWRFVYRPDYPVCSELPEKVTAFKAQQARWTKGGVQVMRKLLPRLLRSRATLEVKIEGLFHLTIGFVHLFLVLFAIVFVPFLVLFGPTPGGLFWFVHPVVILGAGGSAVLFFLVGQYFRERRWFDLVLTLAGCPLILSFGLAMSLTCLGAVFAGLMTRGGEFVRTPKGGRQSDLGGGFAANRIRRPLWVLAGLEVGIAVLLMAGAIHFTLEGVPLVALMLLIKAGGFLLLIGWFLRETFELAKIPDRVEIIPILDS